MLKSIDAFESGSPTAREGKDNEYNIELVKDEYIKGDFINKIDTAWITFRT